MNDKQRKNALTMLLVIVGFALALGVGAFGYMWYLAKHSPSIIREGEIPKEME